MAATKNLAKWERCLTAKQRKHLVEWTTRPTLRHFKTLRQKQRELVEHCWPNATPKDFAWELMRVCFECHAIEKRLVGGGHIHGI